MKDESNQEIGNERLISFPIFLLSLCLFWISDFCFRPSQFFIPSASSATLHEGDGETQHSKHFLTRKPTMGTESGDRQQQKVREFMSLLPLTLELAGLPRAEAGRYYNEGQIDARGTTIKTAYKVARQLILDVVK
jgi:hypothetical protein